jgi:addiction module HigA family antidote
MAKRTAAPHPGQILLKRAMEPLGISRNQLARDLDVPVGRISDITNGKRGVTADTALRFGRYFGTGPELWLRLQAEYDIDVARMSSWKIIEERVRILNVSESIEKEDDGPTALDKIDHADRGVLPAEAGEPLHAENTTPDSRQDGFMDSAASADEPATGSDEDIGIPPVPSV